MDESSVWETRRVITLLAVFALHLALVALLVMAPSSRKILASADHPVELIFLPMAKVPTERTRVNRLQHLSAAKAISLAPPMLNSPSPSAPASVPNGEGNGNGSAINWVAEAHRALRAFEIRRDQPPTSATSASTLWDDWWPQQKHHAGDQFKTASGDWIVWINANCYQVAAWHPGAPVVSVSQPQTICPDEAAKR